MCWAPSLESCAYRYPSLVGSVGAASPGTTGVVQATRRMSSLDRNVQQWHN